MAALPEPDFDRNDPTHDEAYEGSVYVFSATGGFTMERGFDTIKLAEQTAPDHLDVTDAIQIKLDVGTFNDKLGLSSFSTITDSFAVDQITLTAEDLTAGLLSPTQVISVGKYETLYSDFASYVTTYFGFDGGFESLFTAASEFKIDDNNTFDGAAFIALLTASAAAPDGNYINELEGSITITNIAKLLKYSVDANVFGNRNPETKDWGVVDGFVAGDLIWVPNGTTITLQLAIDPEAFNPLNNNGPSKDVNQTTIVTSENFSSTTTATTTLIKRVVTAPLLIKLVTV